MLWALLSQVGYTAIIVVTGLNFRHKRNLAMRVSSSGRNTAAIVVKGLNFRHKGNLPMGFSISGRIHCHLCCYRPKL